MAGSPGVGAKQPDAPARVDCCVVGGGPAGMVLGYLLARGGVQVCVLEKHRDFFRDFRGDTIHPSTLDILQELGLLEKFLQLPHQEVRELRVFIDDVEQPIADFTRLPSHCDFIAFMPQWDFLNFFAQEARAFPNFSLLMEAEVTDLLRDGGKVTGVRGKSPRGPFEVTADLVVGCDGRHSTTRAKAQLEVLDLGAPIDVLWFKLPRVREDPSAAFGRVHRGSFLVLIDRGESWQCGFVIPKGTSTAVREKGLEWFRGEIARSAPFLHDHVSTLQNWDEIKLLTVAVDRLKTWNTPGLLCIGDAAHAMSPVGGVGINLAIQDAVAAANILAEPLRGKNLSEQIISRVQKRREFSVRVIQRMQVLVHRRVITPIFAGEEKMKVPFPLKLLRWFPRLRGIPARFVGLGVRREHVRTRPVT